MKHGGNQPSRFKSRLRHTSFFIVLATAGFGTAFAADVWKSPGNFLDGSRILVTCNNAKLPSKIDIAEFKARDLVVLKNAYVIPQKGARYGDSKSKREDVDAFESSEHFSFCGDEDEFILVGKDTSIKKRWKETLPIDDLFKTIDAMPMRRYEMRTRGGN